MQIWHLNGLFFLIYSYHCRFLASLSSFYRFDLPYFLYDHIKDDLKIITSGKYLLLPKLGRRHMIKILNSRRSFTVNIKNI